MLANMVYDQFWHDSFIPLHSITVILQLLTLVIWSSLSVACTVKTVVLVGVFKPRGMVTLLEPLSMLEMIGVKRFTRTVTVKSVRVVETEGGLPPSLARTTNWKAHMHTILCESTHP
ncbi:hypothetical protein DPMN_025787 [Dreissena polymorpha]|uniref:Uncharacterized protein n=1 Tax=Dreissena polymorpha TaxID=45954 RepID=A0A9D4LS81_DREPO|nr:hypothetical protein DPMN_025787 [Dreissena polymorpha]